MKYEILNIKSNNKLNNLIKIYEKINLFYKNRNKSLNLSCIDIYIHIIPILYY
jgi:hypothetical protein